MRAERLTDVITEHGEGALWDERDGVLRCVDMLAGDVVTVDGDEVTARQNFGRIAAAWRPRRTGGMVVATERGFSLTDSQGAVTALPAVFDDPGARMNEGGCSPDGHFYCGSMAYDTRPGGGSVYRLDPDHQVSTVADDVTISNGLAWVPDGSFFYYVDTPTQAVSAVRLDAAGRFGEQRTVVSVPEDAGSPDGMTLDADGNLWVAMWGGSAVHCYSPSGELLDTVEVDARQVTSCAFGGSDYRTLFITTSREGLTDDDDPVAGSIFACTPGTVGFAAFPYAG
ncbi:SMP-30/gluconolactonase/LRE family protein [Epidermidibacterium keratini]|uniref:SMP-30/gluconolactonase/LRE family protein n=1 Tax=Epidermidibacterium keratini TaxID=1891644 RepID=A0A7L4YNM5_9ACTN|nr:SMP-30/gluconolactonase/LRE family protein [Epidermidibacterium keratini]QHC00632.1 SMP-30/gluconolactonase/LRE family protein [Epidermidibacterium keratini]